jgi:hypothetical protein
MYHLTNLLLTLTFLTSIHTTQAYIPITDRELGVLQEKPYCPARPASPSFQRAAFYEFISEIFYEADGIHQSFENFISVDYIQHSPFILSGRNNTIAAIDSLGGSYDGINITIIQVCDFT